MISKAKEFLKKALDTSHNKKPVYEHSVRVFEILQKQKCNENVLIAGLLHDVVEDTAFTLDDIKNEFGPEVANLVGLLTMNSDIDDYEAQYKENFERLKECPEAIAIRWADIEANRPYVKLADNATQQKVLAKHEYFANMFKGDIL